MNFLRIIPPWLKIFYFKLTGARPWSRGYFTFKYRYIKTILSNQQLLEKFKNSKTLPAGFGQQLDERVIEYPWVLSQLSEKESLLLDAGSALNFKEILEFPALKKKRL